MVRAELGVGAHRRHEFCARDGSGAIGIDCIEELAQLLDLGRRGAKGQQLECDLVHTRERTESLHLVDHLRRVLEGGGGAAQLLAAGAGLEEPSMLHGLAGCGAARRVLNEQSAHKVARGIGDKGPAAPLKRFPREGSNVGRVSKKEQGQYPLGGSKVRGPAWVLGSECNMSSILRSRSPSPFGPALKGRRPERSM